MSDKKEIQKLLRNLRAQGWRVVETKAGRYKVYSPDGVTMVVVHKTPSDHRWLQNTIRDLRKGGYDPK